MPLQTIQTHNPDLKLGLWEIEPHDVDFLIHFPFQPQEKLILDRVKHPAKQLQWAASRQCLRQLIDLDHTDCILNDAKGAPFLWQQNVHVSLSHTATHTAALASESRLVGVDIELLNDSRGFAARRMFMNAKELAFFDRLPNVLTFYTIWAAKESLFKICNRFYDEISFKNQLETFPPENGFGTEGKFDALFLREGKTRMFEIFYQTTESYVLVWTAANPAGFES